MLYKVQISHYTTDGLLGWLHDMPSQPLESVAILINWWLEKGESSMFILNPEHPHYLDRVRFQGVNRCNIRVRDESGKLVKWKHLL